MKWLPVELTENGIHYTLRRDCYLPDLRLPESPEITFGHFGRIRKTYMEEHHSGICKRLIMSVKLYDRLTEIDRICQERMGQMIGRRAEAEGVGSDGLGFPDEQHSSKRG